MGVGVYAVWYLGTRGWGGAALQSCTADKNCLDDTVVESLMYSCCGECQGAGTSGPVIIQSNQWGEAFKPLSRPPQQAVQFNMVYQPQEVFLVSTSIAARLISADRESS